jgi:hypothetical protein
MSKYILALVTVFFSLQSADAQYNASGNRKRYNAAIMITNPLGMYTKIGVGGEIRIRQTSVIVSGAKYSGVYEGKQYRFEVNKYIKTNKKNESYWYAKVCGGDATYVPDKFSFLNDKSKETVGPAKYIGGGIGLGRRININHFFLLMNFGVKYVALPPDFSDEKAEKFRLFYATGPGSVLDCNLRLGYQF